jgi:hypothetical protein
MQIIGFDNVTWFYLNNPTATASDCLMTEDGFLWFKYGDQITDSPTLDIEYSESFDEWTESMSNFDMRYCAIGDCGSYGEASERLQ